MQHLPPDSVLQHVLDVHCHPTDPTYISNESISRLKINICAMSTHTRDQSLVRNLAQASPNVTPCFGHHPWFSHTISLLDGLSKNDHYLGLFQPKTPDETAALQNILQHLPEPIPLSNVLSCLHDDLVSFPSAMLGEVGIDRAFRVPYDYFASPRVLTPFYLPFEHQIAVLEAQIGVAIELERNISLHTVKAPAETEALFQRMADTYKERWLKISVDLHSCTLSVEMLKTIQGKHPNVFLSLSTVINARSKRHIALIEACPPTKILAESDFNDIDCCTERTWSIIQTIAEVKGWAVEDDWEDDVDIAKWGVVRRLESNWNAFKAGNHRKVVPKSKRVDIYYSGSESEE